LLGRFITWVSSGFGRELSAQPLDHGDHVVGTDRDLSKVTDLMSGSDLTCRLTYDLTVSVSQVDHAMCSPPPAKRVRRSLSR
jgi:hypothetical protein